MRYFVTLVHLTIAGGNTATALWFLTQARLNLLWETGFYGNPSIGTSVLGIGGALSLAFATVQSLFAVGHALRQRWATRGLLIVSFVLVIVLPPPTSWFIAALTGSVWVSLRRPQAEPPAET